MAVEIWTKEQENYLRYLYSKDCPILDFVSDFNNKFKTNRSKQSLIHKASRMDISSDFVEGSRYNHIKNMLDRQKRIGQTNMSNDGTLMKIIDYKGSLDVLVEFQDEFKYQEWVEYNNFKKGVVKNPYWRQLYGKGYLGVGPYAPYVKKGEKTKAHDAWIRMFDRCYSEKFHDNHPTYVGCEVCDEWCDFQNFAKWFYSNYYDVSGQSIEVDKDWLYIGNKIYCPERCCLAPNIINTCLLTHDKLINFDLPMGVSPTASGRYKARCSEYGKRKDLGTYDTPQEAEVAYWNFKIKYIEGLAEEYKNFIPNSLYDVMMKFKNTYIQRYNLDNICEVA